MINAKQYILDHYADTLNSDLMAATGLTLHQIYRIAHKAGMKKSKWLIAAMARERTSDPSHPAHRTTFKKGHATFNKGKKQTEYMSDEAIERCKATQFKHGSTPWNTKEDGLVSWRRCFVLRHTFFFIFKI
jgi:hypothetical protein